MNWPILACRERQAKNSVQNFDKQFQPHFSTIPSGKKPRYAYAFAEIMLFMSFIDFLIGVRVSTC